jgi:hypothetical protein
VPLAIWIGAIIPHAVSQDQEIMNRERWGIKLVITSIAVSMAVNALATGLIVLRIFRVVREVTKATSDEKLLGVQAGGKKLWYIIFVIIESGMALFAIQLTRAAIIPSILTAANYDTFSFCGFHGIHQMLNVIIVSVFVAPCFTDNLDLTRV